MIPREYNVGQAMNTLRILTIFTICAVLLGCKGGEPTTAQKGASSPTASTVPAPGIEGTYKVDLKMPEGKKDDPAAEFGKAMTGMMQMMFSGSKLEIQSGGRFKITMMGMPVEGPYVLDGKKITLTPDKVMGMTVEEAKKLNPNNTMDTKPMTGSVSEDFKTITLDSEKPGEPGVNFVKAPAEQPEAPVKETVSTDEKSLIGEYSGEMELPEPKTDKEKQDAMMAKAMSGSLSLKLKADNTFTMNVMFELEGTWSLQSGAVVLNPTKVLGMDTKDTDSKKPQPLRGVVGEDGKTLTVTNPDQPGSKLIFTKK